jgi:ABC-2 type transport system ATP-binding protein
MNPVFEARELTRRFGDTVALDRVDLVVPAGSVVGLIGRNGGGKTTLMNLVLGLVLPTSGRCATFGTDPALLEGKDLARIGAVHQEHRMLGWMTVEQHIRYVSAFHPGWDQGRERLLLSELALEPRARVMKLSPGNRQKLAVLLAVCSKPALLLLDEPVSAMDPIARERMLAFLLELVREDGTTVVVSSHVLRDIERVVDRIVCLERGRVCVDCELDELLERYGEWSVTPRNGAMPARFDEDYVLAQDSDGHCARLVVRGGANDRSEFERRHHVEVAARALNLEAIFPYLVEASEASTTRGLAAEDVR